MYHVGIDLGGTKVEGVVVDSSDLSKPLCRTRVPTESDQGYAHILDQIVKLYGLLENESGIKLPGCLGIGTPGVEDPTTRLIRGSNTQCLIGKPLPLDLEQRLGKKVISANDANCFALAEATMGAAQGYETVFGIIMGTGCGAGLVVHEKVLNGRHGIAGEWGQIVLEPEGPVSRYGTVGTIEAMLAGPAVEDWYESQCGTRKKLKDIALDAEAGTDELAQRTIDRLTDYFARSVNIILNVMDPHAIVVGGGVGNVKALYSQETREKINRICFAPPLQTDILPPTLGDSAGVFGAAMLTR